MSGFNKDKTMEVDPNHEAMNYKFTHSMMKSFETGILNHLEPDASFTYLPVISRYQISTQPYCDVCCGLLLNQEKDLLHLQTPHNYPCPNEECHHAFVQQSHLDIHLKMCGELRKLSKNAKGIKTDEKFEEIMRFALNPPMNNYFEMVNDVFATKEWITEQFKRRQKHKRNGKKSIEDVNVENEHKRKLAQVTVSDGQETVYVPQVKRRKLNGNSNNRIELMK
eukprot:164459_1